MSTPLSDQDFAGIKALMEEMNAALLSNDWDKWLAKVTDDFVLLPPDQPSVEGKEATQKWVVGFPKVKAFDFQVTRMDGRDDFGWVWGHYSMTAEPEPGKPMSLKGKVAATYYKQADGSWLMASDIWNLDEPPTAG